MSPGVPGSNGLARRFPRVSGDEPYRKQKAAVAKAFSPRERG